MAIDPMRRRLLLARRRQINPYRRLDAVRVEGCRFRFTCRTCGFAFEEEVKSNVKGAAPLPESALAHLAKWWSKECDGCTGHCPRCTQAARDAVAPLPKESP